MIWFGEKVDQKNFFDVCLSQGDNWLYPSPLTHNRQMADTGRDFSAKQKFVFLNTKT